MPTPLTPYEPGTFLNIGTDIAEVTRVRASAERMGEAFLKKVFTDAEIALCEQSANKWQRYAARFAAKEAASKALGTGIGGHFGLKSVSVESGPDGEPVAVLDEAGQKAVAQRGGTRLLVTLSHTAELATATVVLIK